jgi:hypothetical protein
MRLNEILVLVLELIARAVWPSFRARIARWACELLPDVPRLAGHWVADFNNPTKGKGTKRLAIDASLVQFGRHISGAGHVQGHPADVFHFRGTIKRNVFYGTFARQDAQVLAGTGTFVLKVMADSKTLIGQCMWYDATLDGVWSSDYEWHR